MAKVAELKDFVNIGGEKCLALDTDWKSNGFVPVIVCLFDFVNICIYSDACVSLYSRTSL